MSTLHVENLKGLSSGGNANKIIVPSGQTLDASNGFTAPAGHVIQVVQSSTSTEVSGNSTSYTDAGLSGSITPTSTSSKVFIIMNMSTDVPDQAQLFIDLRRNGTSIRAESYMGYTSGGGYLVTRQPFFELDSPSSTSQVTYTTFFKHYSTSYGTSYLHYDDNGGRETVSTLTLMEIAG